MKPTRIFSILTATLAFFTAPLHAADAPKALDAIVENAMKGYNAGDAKIFFTDYAKSLSSIATPAMFDALYTNMAMKEFGKYVSKKLIAGESVVQGETPLLVYEAKFEKNPKVKLSINFMQEDGKPKLMQVTIAKFQ